MELTELEARIKQAEDADQTATAIELLELYRKRDRSNQYYLYLLAENLRVIGRTNDAEDLFRLLDVSRVPPLRRYLIDLSRAKLYEDLGDLSRAELHFRAAAAETPSSTVPWIYLGGFLAKCGRVTEAISVLSIATEKTGDADEAHLNLGHCYRAQRAYDKAKAHYRAALDLSPGYEEARRALQDTKAAMAVLLESGNSTETA